MTDQELIKGLRKLSVGMADAGYIEWHGMTPLDVLEAADRWELVTDANRLREEQERIKRAVHSALSHLQTI
jgi:hypothetical protein